MSVEIAITPKLSDLISSAMESSNDKLFSEVELNIFRHDMEREKLSVAALRLLAKYLKIENKQRKLQDFMTDSKHPLHFPEFVKPATAVSEWLV